MSRLNGRINHTGPIQNPVQYHHPVISEQQYTGTVTPLYQGPLKDNSRDDYEPSCLVKTPSGSVYIPSDDYPNNSTLGFKQEQEYCSPFKSDSKSMENYNSHFGTNINIPVLPLRNNLRNTRGGTTPPSSYDTSLGGDRGISIAGNRPLPFYRKKGGVPRCTWKVTAVIFISVTVVLLALLGFFIVRNLVPTVPSEGGCSVVLSDDTAPADEESLVNHAPNRGNKKHPSINVFRGIKLDKRPDLPRTFPEVVEKFGYDSRLYHRMRRSVSHDVDLKLRMKQNAFNLVSPSPSVIYTSPIPTRKLPSVKFSSVINSFPSTQNYSSNTSSNISAPTIHSASRFLLDSKSPSSKHSQLTSPSNPFSSFLGTSRDMSQVHDNINFKRSNRSNGFSPEVKNSRRNEKLETDLVYAPLTDVVEYENVDISSQEESRAIDDESDFIEEEYSNADTESISNIDYVYGETSQKNDTVLFFTDYETESNSSDILDDSTIGNRNIVGNKILIRPNASDVERAKKVDITLLKLNKLYKNDTNLSINNNTAIKYFSNISSKAFHRNLSSPTKTVPDEMLADDPRQYNKPNIGNQEKTQGRSNNPWNLNWMYGRNIHDSQSADAFTSPKKQFLNNPIKGGRIINTKFSALKLRENFNGARERRMNSRKPSLGRFKKGGKISSTLSDLASFANKGVVHSRSLRYRNSSSRFSVSDGNTYDPRDKKGGKIPLSDPRYLPSELLKSMGVKNLSLRENPGMIRNQEAITSKQSGRVNTAADIFPHIFEYDLEGHDDYYYEDDSPWYEQYWSKTKGREDDSMNRKFPVKGEARTKSSTSIKRSREYKTPTEVQNSLPNGMKVMALTREGFHIESNTLPRTVSVETKSPVYEYNDKDEIEIVTLGKSDVDNSSQVVYADNLTDNGQRSSEKSPHLKNFDSKILHRTPNDVYVESTEVNIYSNPPQTLSPELARSITVDGEKISLSSTSKAIPDSMTASNLSTENTINSSERPIYSKGIDNSGINMFTDTDHLSLSDTPHVEDRSQFYNFPDKVAREKSDPNLEINMTKSSDMRSTASFEFPLISNASEAFSAGDIESHKLNDVADVQNNYPDSDNKEIESEDNNINGNLKVSGGGGGGVGFIELSEGIDQENKRDYKREISDSEEKIIKSVDVTPLENAGGTDILPSRVMVNVSISTGNDYSNQKTNGEKPVYFLSILVPTALENSNPKISVANSDHSGSHGSPITVEKEVESRNSLNLQRTNDFADKNNMFVNENNDECTCDCPCSDNSLVNDIKNAAVDGILDPSKPLHTTPTSPLLSTSTLASSTGAPNTIPPLPPNLLLKIRDHHQRPEKTIPPDGTTFRLIDLGSKEKNKIPPYSYWNMQFYLAKSAYVTFEVTVPRGASLGIYGRRNALPTHTSYDFIQVLSGYKVQGSGRTTRSNLIPTQAESLVKYLEEGHWFLSVYNDDGDPQELSFRAEVSSQFTEGCPAGCSGNGDCILGSCQCHTGFDGPACTEMKCPVLCSGNGEYKEGQCVCRPGWKGNECSVRHDECEVPDCHGHGHCLDGKCLCANGFKGQFCEDVDCPHPNCSGHGWCVNGTCICQKGWRGPACASMDDAALQCLPDCSGKGHFDLVGQQCVCEPGWTGSECNKRICDLNCGHHGQCEEDKCLCRDGWMGDRCDLMVCDPRCDEHGQCKNGTCICMTGWNGRHCTLSGCPGMCRPHGSCVMMDTDWECKCQDGWEGLDCSIKLEDVCNDGIDNDEDGLTDCADGECCSHKECTQTPSCMSSIDPIDILLRKQPPAVTASFFQKMQFIIEEDSLVQLYADVNSFNMSRASIVRGRIVSGRGSGLVGVRVSPYRPKNTGFTLSRQDGWFDLMVNGGGAVKLNFGKSYFLPITKTVWVPWNEIVVMDTVVLTAAEAIPPPPPTSCPDHDYISLKPVVLATWKHGFQGGCAECSAILTESQVLQESLDIPGTGLNLVYHSSRALGYKSTIQLQLTPSKIPSTLRLIRLRVTIEGILFEKTFEADADIKFTYSWNRLNVYRQRVYGVTWAIVKVGYAYSNCDQVIWDTQSTQVSGFDMSVSDIGGWDLSIHHRYNFHEGILQKGDGRNMYMEQRPRILKTLIGDGRQREVSCLNCDGKSNRQRLLTPASLAAAPDGSLYVADFNLIRRIFPDNIARTIVRLNETRVSYRYHLAVSPVDGSVYISDPDSHQILKVKDPEDSTNPDENFMAFVGSGERCLPGDEIGCGDGGLARDAKLQYPKGMAISSKDVLYFADGTNVRAVDGDGIINTIIGTHRHRSHWQPLPCSGTLSVIDANLRWPTSLGLSPLDESLYVLDDHHVLRLTADGRVKVIAGRPLHCPPLPKTTPSDLAAQTTLRSPQSIAFTPNGDLYIAESDSERINRIRVITTDERIHDFAGGESKCNCRDEDCVCFDEGHIMASTAIFSTISAIAVSPDGAVHILDQGNLRVRSIVASIPQLTEDGYYEIYSPETQELYIFNRFGHHIETRNIPTNRSVYLFKYDVNTSTGKLSSVTDAAGNMINFLRAYSGEVTMIKNSRQQKCRLKMSRMRRLEEIETPDQHKVTFTYHVASGLLRSRMESTGIAHVYSYDDYGRLTRIVTPSGQIIDLSFDLSEEGALVTATRDGLSPVTMLIKGTVVTETIGSASTVTAQLPDGSVITRNPWGHHIATETIAYNLLRDKVLANSFPIHGRQRTEINNELVNSFEWKYFMDKGDDHSIVKQMGRKMRVNGEDLLTFKYDVFSGTEAVVSKQGITLLNVTYDDLGRPLRWTPASPYVPVALSYDRSGLLREWKWGELREHYHYDHAGRFEGVSFADRSQLTYSYRDILSIKPYKVSVDQGMVHQLEYDANGALSALTTPRGHKYIFQVQPSVLHNRFIFISPSSPHHPYQVLYSDSGKILSQVLPHQAGRIIYDYDEAGRIQHQIFGDGSVEYGYQPDTGLIRSVTLRELAYEHRTNNTYHAGLLKEQMLLFGPAVPQNAAKMKFLYDGNARPRRVEIEINGNRLLDYDTKYDMIRGTLEAVDDLRIIETSLNKITIQNSKKSMIRVTTYNPHGWIKEDSLTIKDRFVHRMSYLYDLRGRLASKTIWQKSTEFQSNYSYSPDGFLQAIEGAESWRFRYDRNGNMISVTEAGREILASYDISDRLVDWGGEKLNAYDAAGRVVRQGDLHFSYTARGNMRYAWKQNGMRMTYRYDHKGRLTSWEDQRGNVTQFFYVDLRRPHLPTHIHFPKTGITHIILYDNLGRIISIQTEEGRFWVNTDINGTPVSVYDSSGVLVKEITRSPWGEILKDTNDKLNLYVDFFGSIKDPVTGLCIFQLKTYDPKHGQWMVPRYDRISNTPEHVSLIYLHRFQDNDPINKNNGNVNHYTAIHNWLRLFGIDMKKTLGSNYHDETLDSSSEELQISGISTSLKIISGLSCSKRSIFKSFSRPSLLPESLVQIDEPRSAVETSSNLLGKFSSSGPVLGPGVLISKVNEKTLVTLVPHQENSVVQAVARDVLNGSSLLDITLPHHRRHTLFLVKEDLDAMVEDLQQLQRLSGLFNVTHHEGDHPEIRVVGTTTSLVLLYGSTPEEARYRLLRHVHHKAAEHAWLTEKRLLETGGPSLHPWTAEEKSMLLREGKVPGYVAAELHSVHRFPLLADDASNVVFRKDIERRRRRSKFIQHS